MSAKRPPRKVVTGRPETPKLRDALLHNHRNADGQFYLLADDIIDAFKNNSSVMWLTTGKRQDINRIESEQYPGGNRSA